MLEKIIHRVEFENLYSTDSERKPKIMSTIEGNYGIARRVYQQLHIDTAELFADLIRSLSSYELQDMDDNIRANGWGIKKISEVRDAQEFMKIFQDFYTLTGRLLLSNGLLVAQDGDAPPGEKLNKKHLYDLFKNTKSHGIVSLPFLGLIQYYLEENDHSLIKSATTELYYNLSYMTLSGARDFKFDAVSDLTARLSILLKHANLRNKKMREIENEVMAKKINDDRIFEPKIEDLLDDVIEIIDQPDPEHKKSMYPYDERTVQTSDEMDKTKNLIDDNFIDLRTKFDQVNDVATEQKKQKKIEDTIETIIDDTNIINKIQNILGNILRNIRPADNRTAQEIIDDQFIPIHNRTQQEIEDDFYISLESENEMEKIDTTTAWNPKKTEVSKPGPIIKLSTYYN